MSRKIKDLFATDWTKELQDGDIMTRKEDGQSMDVVLLAGLQRLAREAGIIKQRVEILTPAPTMVQAIFTTVFHIVADCSEVEFVGTADCNTKNTSGKFASYPTAVAESRAEARSLRKALGIKMLSSEEVGFREGATALEASPDAKIGSQQIVAIEKLCETRGIDLVTALGGALPEERASVIFELSELTIKEAQLMMSWLNGQKSSAKKVKTTKEKRDARKAELKK